MAYNAEINVSVKNLNQVSELETKLSSISRNVNALNKGTGGGRRGGGRRGGGGGSEPDPLKEEIASLKLQNTAITQANRGRRAQNKLKADGLGLEEAIQSLESIGSRESIKDLDAVRKEIELKKKIVIETERDLIKQKEKTAELVKQVEVRKKVASPTVVSHPALMGPHQATKGAGQAAMSIDTITKQSDKRLAVELKLRELEAQGVNTKKLRVKMGELVDAQNRKDFGTIKKINRELGRGISKEKGKLRVLKLQNQERAREDKEIRRTAPRQALNFDKRTGGLLRGPAGTSRNTLGNIGRRLAPKRGFDFGSALISGGFPLLFGQGPGVAAAGALGGGIGGMFGQMGGFAGGIAATAAVQSIQNAINGIGELGKAMNRLNPNISAMSQAMGIAGTVEEKRLQLIEKNLGKQAAFNAALEMLGEKIGADKAEELRKFGATFQRLGNEVTLFFTKVQAAIAKLLNQVLDAGADANLRGRARTLVSQNPNNAAFRDINKEIADLESQRSGAGRKGAKDITDRINKLKQERLQIAETIILEKDKDKLRVKTNKLITAGLADLKQENELNRAILAGNEEEFRIKQAVKDKVDEMGLSMKDLNDAQKQRIRDDVVTNKNLKEQARIQKEIANSFKNMASTIQNDIKDGIKGLIKGTSTLGDLVNNVADRFLDMALNQALFGNVGGDSVTGGLFKFLGFANGGRPPVGRPSIVGEKGPELFVPRSSGTIVPNNKLGGGSNTSVVVNVDASGSEVQGNESQAKELGTALSVAVRQELLKQQRPGGLLSSIR